MELIRYEAACRAVSEAKNFDEIKEISDSAEAMRAYARQAKNKGLEIDAAEIRFRAERRIGEMEKQQKELGLLNKGGRPSNKPGSKTNPLFTPPTLKEIGLDKALASRCRKFASVPEEQFEELIGDWRNRVAQENERVSMSLLQAGTKAEKRQEKEIFLANKIKALPDMQFGVILADPPWKFEVRSSLGLDRSAENHYPCQTTDEIMSLDVPSISADDCVLFLWATVPMIEDALAVMSAWGFTYKSHFCWIKNRYGTGYWNRNKHELLLVGTRGNVPAPAMGTQWPSVIDADVGEHSAKPTIFYQMIEEYYPNLPKLEMNCRGSGRAAWSSWGLEAE
jgi:N6-adenosine-specific RNA methylase IME4